MDPKLFQNSAAGRVIKIGQGDVAYYAFLPNPLPPDLNPDWQLSSALSEADRALSELAGLGRTLPNPNLFIRPFLRREAVLSSKIEGTKSDLTDLYMYEGGQLTLPGVDPFLPENADVREVYNYVRALEDGLSQLEQTPVSMWMLRGLHKTLLQDVRGQYATPGEYRTSQNWIGGNTIHDAIYVPPPVIELEPALNNLEQYFYRDGYPPLIRLALIHYQFEAIHPFVDGNGRIGRLLLSLLLVSWKLLPLPLLHLSAYIEPHREEYYDLLLGVSQKGAWKDWLMFFLHTVRVQACDTVDRIKAIQDIQRLWHTRLREAHAAASTIQLADYLFEAPILTIPRAQQILGMSHRGATLVVQKLVSFGVLSPVEKSGHAKLYLARDILDMIVEEYIAQ